MLPIYQSRLFIVKLNDYTYFTSFNLYCSRDRLENWPHMKRCLEIMNPTSVKEGNLYVLINNWSLPILSIGFIVELQFFSYDESFELKKKGSDCDPLIVPSN